MALHPSALVGHVRDDVARSARRARNAVRYVASVDRPPVGSSPRETVWTQGKVRLDRFVGAPVRRSPPVLLVHSLVSRSYIPDLLPDSSFAGHLRDAGYDVHLIDWGTPDEGDAANTLEDYVDGYLLDAVDAVRQRAGTSDVTLVGYCFGAVLAALFAARRPDVVRNLVTLAAPVDYTRLGLMTQLFATGRLAPEDVIRGNGLVPADVLYNSFRLMKPTGDLVQYVNLWDKLADDEFVRAFSAMNGWVKDHVPFPGAAFRQIAQQLFRDNGLLAGSVSLNGQPARLADIRCPLLNVYAERDHIVEPAAAAPLLSLVSSADRTKLRIRGGHAALVTGRQSTGVTLPGIVDWLDQRSDALPGTAAS